MSLMTVNKFKPIPFSISLYNSPLCQTVSKAGRRSTKHANIFLLSFTRYLVIKDFKIKILSVVDD